jgi:hypothetical protein
MPRNSVFDTVICFFSLGTSFRLGSALSWRSAVPALWAEVASRACGHPVTHRELDLAAVDANVPQRAIVKLLQLANGAAPASFDGPPSRESRTPQDEHAQPLHGRAHAGVDEQIALDGGLPLEFEGRQRGHGITCLGHSGALRRGVG